MKTSSIDEGITKLASGPNAGALPLCAKSGSRNVSVHGEELGTRRLATDNSASERALLGTG